MDSYLLRVETLEPIHFTGLFEPDELVLVVTHERWISEIGEAANDSPSPGLEPEPQQN